MPQSQLERSKRETRVAARRSTAEARDAVFITAKDLSHGLWGTPVDQSTKGAAYAPGFEPGRK
jgi:hypothetical protein